MIGNISLNDGKRKDNSDFRFEFRPNLVQESATKCWTNEFPKFCGENAIEWLYQCEHTFEINRTPAESRVEMAVMHMEEKALQWYKILIRARLTRDPLRWKKFVDAVRFSKQSSLPSSLNSAFVEKMECKQRETKPSSNDSKFTFISSQPLNAIEPQLSIRSLSTDVANGEFNVLGEYSKLQASEVLSNHDELKLFDEMPDKEFLKKGAQNYIIDGGPNILLAEPQELKEELNDMCWCETNSEFTKGLEVSDTLDKTNVARDLKKFSTKCLKTSAGKTNMVEILKEVQPFEHVSEFKTSNMLGDFPYLLLLDFEITKVQKEVMIGVVSFLELGETLKKSIAHLYDDRLFMYIKIKRQ
ncbi:hypothetical protein BUALT_Bualt19G0080100 [Buddleja alternifolia]|uniref:Retrotransposon gag domain-containing protein n=1 Tax=Buddleja alternifolia TaxID=168488 RepID=A0AAV6W2M2_9LAMI|nr:hypothetical protein BUALT_Bualt19G0080100 [Buddleja alternifolia]